MEPGGDALLLLLLLLLPPPRCGSAAGSGAERTHRAAGAPNPLPSQHSAGRGQGQTLPAARRCSPAAISLAPSPPSAPLSPQLRAPPALGEGWSCLGRGRWFSPPPGGESSPPPRWGCVSRPLTSEEAAAKQTLSLHPSGRSPASLQHSCHSGSKRPSRGRCPSLWVAARRSQGAAPG